MCSKSGKGGRANTLHLDISADGNYERAGKRPSFTLDGSHLMPCQLESLHATNPINCQTSVRQDDGTVSSAIAIVMMISRLSVRSSSNLVIYMLRGF